MKGALLGKNSINMDLIYWFNVILRRIWVLIVIPLVASLIGFFYAFTANESFKSSGQISTGITTRNDLPLGDDSFNFRESEIKFNNLLQIMKSDQVVGLVSYKLLLHDLKSTEPFRSPATSVESPLLSTPMEVNRLLDNLTNKLDSTQVLSSFKDYDKEISRLLRYYGYDHISLKKTMVVERIKFTDYVLISCSTESPTLSAFIVNELCEEFIRFNGIINLETSDESVKFFGNLVAQKKKELDEKNQALKEFKSINSVTDYRVESELNEQQIKQFENSKEEEERKIRQIRISLANVESRLSKLRGESPDSETIRQGNQRILILRDKIQKLNQRYIDTGSSNQSLMDSLIIVRREYQNETDRINNLVLNSKPAQQSIIDLENQYNELNLNLQIAESSLSSIDFKLRTLRAGKSTFSSKEVTIDDLQREVDLASSEYISAQERYNSARNKAMAAGSSIKQIMMAQPALGPESNNTIIITLFSWFSSFAICLLIILAFEFIDTSIKTPLVFKHATGLRLAGAINYLKKFERGIPSMDDLFNLNSDPDSKAFQHLLRSVRYEIETSKKKIFLFTSTKPKEGKTFAIIALSYSLSLMHKKILIVDTNFKNNQLSKLLSQHQTQERELVKVEKSTQLVITGHWDSGSKQGLITPTIYPYVYKIESKPSSKSAAEILIEKDFGALITEIAPFYDYIFLEGASLNDFSDTKELEAYVESVIPVFSANSTIKQIDNESIEYLKSLGPKLFGAILNRVDTKNLKL
jgi:succinoglycan biosynthesis transport protein ExoP